MSWFADLHEFCRPGVALAPLTWYRLGGPAEWLAEPRSADELATLMHRCHETQTPLRVVGLGANLLVGDAGVRGVVVRLSAPHFERVEYLADGRVVAGGGAHLTRLVKATVDRGLAGLEVLAGIPGTVGGGVRMNCGGRFGELADCVVAVRLTDASGRIVRREKGELGFAYRTAAIGDALVTGVEFQLQPTDAEKLKSRYREIWQYKAEHQPALEKASAGCVFKNPEPGRSAGRLIDELGLKGLRRGGAVVSDEHANFIVADAGAKSADVIAVIEAVEQAVLERTGIRLSREVEIW